MIAAFALGIGAASFANGSGRGERGAGRGNWERAGDGASKDTAESPTAEPERKKKTTRLQDYKKVKVES